MAVIYKATNTINGKSYIGFAVDFEKRKKKHIAKASGDKREYFHNAILKYGIDNFDWSILKEDATLEDEIRLIAEYDTFHKGYNLTQGGEGKLGYVTSEETKQKISNSHKGKTMTEQQLATLRANAQRMKETGHTDEAKAKISARFKGTKLSEEHKKKISENHAAHKESGAYYQSDEYKEKMSKALKGKKRSPESIERYRQAALNRSAEHKQKIADAKKAKQ